MTKSSIGTDTSKSKSNWVERLFSTEIVFRGHP